MEAFYPQEIEVWYVLPAIRSELAKAMKRLKLSQKAIAGHLGITEAAVSQYVNRKRADGLKLDSRQKALLADAAGRIAEGSSGIMEESQRFLQALWQDGTMCRLHHGLGKVPKGCRACMR